MGTMEWILGAGWLVYGAVHSLLATHSAKTYARAILGRHFRLYRLIYSLLAIGLLLPLVVAVLLTPSGFLWTPSAFQVASGIAMSVLGILLSSATLKRYFSTPAGFRDLFLEGEIPPLQTRGLHQWVRHPLYLSTFLFIWGIFLAKPTYAMLVSDLSITVYTLIAIRWEEKKLVSMYGEAYKRYQQDVPMIIPKWK